MRSHERTARRYAKALYDVAREAGATEAIGQEMEQVAATLAADAAAHDVLTRPWIKPADRRGVAMAIAQKLGAGKLVQDFLGLVAERGRADHLPEIVGAYQTLVDAELGRARAQVRTAVALTDGEKRRSRASSSTRSASASSWKSRSTPRCWAGSSRRSAASSSTAVSTRSSRVCASGSQGDST